MARHKRALPVHSLIWFGCYALLGPLPIWLFWGAAKWMFSHDSRWIVVAYPVAGAMIGGLAVLLLLFTLETAERRKTVTQMGRFMSAGVLREVLAHPEEGYPLPRRARATIVFTDLQGFTPYSETHEPEEVVEALNAYMTRMVPIIIRHGGEIDKYIGDAIMAFFGVPVPQPGHAASALRCAVEMQRECALFRAQTGIPFYTRIGIHTGEVIAGCMGSEGAETKINYTVIGDAVNLAARLEGKNKDLGSWILCSAATYEAAPDVARGEKVRVEVKGKADSLDAYKVWGLQGEPPDEAAWEPPAAVGDTV
jgi:adenylate cyclase